MYTVAKMAELRSSVCHGEMVVRWSMGNTISPRVSLCLFFHYYYVSIKPRGHSRYVLFLV
jgi:hypothetical protein